MAEDIKNTATGGATAPEEGERTFTQDQLNQIVQDRLAKEKTKAEAAQAELAQREQELAHRELLLTARMKLVENNLSLDLLDAINATSPEAIETSIAAIKKAIAEAEARAHNAPIKGYVPAPSRDRTFGARGQFDAVRQGMGLNREE